MILRIKKRDRYFFRILALVLLVAPVFLTGLPKVTALNGYKAGFETMEHPELLPFWLPDGTLTKQFITYDQTGDNGDGGLSRARRYVDGNGETVIFDEYGPGCLYRQQMNIWQQQPGIDPAVIRIKYYFDDDPSPRVNLTINEFWGYHQVYTAPFTQPLTYFDDLPWNPNHPNAFDRMGVCYYPFPFKNRLKVTLAGPSDKLQNFGWYQYTYLKYATGTDVETWTGTGVDSPVVRNQWNNLGTDPKSTTGNVFTTITVAIPRGGTANVLSLSGQASIASINLDLSPYSADTFYNTNIKIYWDGSATPAVDLPLGYFFGAGGKNDPYNSEIWNITYKSLLMGYSNTNHNFYNYWPMPFWSSARIDIVNSSNTDISSLKFDVNYKLASAYSYASDKAGYFYARRTESYGNQNGLYFVKAFEDMGRGKVAALSMFYTNWSCDGDEFSYIDDSKTPQMHGDGSEDDHNMGWGGDKYQKALWGSWARYGDHGGIQRDLRIYYNENYIYNRGISMKYEMSNLGYNPSSYSDSTVFYYKDLRGSNLGLTDELDVGNATSEAAHSYTINAQTWSGSYASSYDGFERNHSYNSATDDGRANKGYSQFQVNIDPANNGVKLRKRVDRYGNAIQKADVYVDGVKVIESPWYLCDLPNAPTDQRWYDTDFEIPVVYTAGKSRITVKIVYLDATDQTNGINEFYYWAYSYKPGITDVPKTHTDEFNSSTLNSAWSWVREDSANWSLTASSGYLRIVCQNGELYQTTNTAENLLLRNAPAADWTIKTKLTFNTGSNNQQAGLLVYQDDNNYLKLVRCYNGANRVHFAKETGGTYALVNEVPVAETTVYLKISKLGTTYSAYYNTDGSDNWTQVGQATGVSLSTIKCGLTCFAGAAANADFDWYDDGTTGTNPPATSTPTPTPTPTPTAPGHTDEFNVSTLGSGWSWVREDSANWSLTARSGYLRINLQGQDLWNANNTENILLRTPSTTDWTIQTKLEFNPTVGYQQAGLIVYSSDDAYLKLIRFYDAAGYQRVGLDKELNLAYEQHTVNTSLTTIYLKLVKAGTTYTGYYNADGGSSWTQVYQYTNLNLGGTLRVGLIAQNTAGVSGDFDWFDVR